MLLRLILPEIYQRDNKDLKRVLEGDFTEEQWQALNAQGYNVYYLPNYPSLYDSSRVVDGSQIDTFEYIYVDMDLKDGKYKDTDEFLGAIGEFELEPTQIVFSGNGVHAYWKVSNLDAITFLRLQRRMMRRFHTDEAVCKIYQLMRLPGSVNTKDPNNPKICEIVFQNDQNAYTPEQLDAALPPITLEDSNYVKQHFDKTYHLEPETKVDEKIPTKFAELIRNSPEVKRIWSGDTDDRSKSDYRLGHIMWANGFTKNEGMSVLVNSAKAIGRAPSHRISYAKNIIDKVWTHEQVGNSALSRSVSEILERSGEALKGTRFPCHSYIDATKCGFKLSHVIGLVAGSGVGKTSMALNMFLGFVQNNPDYVHFFIPLEQKVEEIADRWRRMCGGNLDLFDKVHLISNYNDDGTFRHLSLPEIRDYVLQFQKDTGRKVGCVVIDHIGALKMENEHGENQRIVDICHGMKSFAIQTNTLLVMQSQAPREKAGIGDLELNKDAAYGSVLFESYVDFLITIWQPIKRCYPEGAPLVTAFKFCKIRHKNTRLDKIQEDVPYKLVFDTETEHFRELTQDEETSFNFFLKKATNKRKEDRKTSIIEYTTITWTGKGNSGKSEIDSDSSGAKGITGLSR